jgi:hypothetical protein
MKSFRDMVKEMWQYDCRCGHTTYFPVGGAQDIICHRCWSYSQEYKGRVPIDWAKLDASQRRGLPIKPKSE